MVKRIWVLKSSIFVFVSVAYQISIAASAYMFRVSCTFRLYLFCVVAGSAYRFLEWLQVPPISEMAILQAAPIATR